MESSSQATAASLAKPAAAAGGSFKRRDYLAEIESQMQNLWKESLAYNRDAPDSNAKGDKEKFFCTFPYPYMNGRLHLGHAFTITKAEFQARYQRLLGKEVLFPFAFHCTGMPIAACADKLKREIAVRETTTGGDGELNTDERQSTKAVDGGGDTRTPSPSTPQSNETGKFSGKKSKAGKWFLFVALGNAVLVSLQIIL